jgi:hypothetical protein
MQRGARAVTSQCANGTWPYQALSTFTRSERQNNGSSATALIASISASGRSVQSAVK